MKISSADVRSLLMRVHDEIQNEANRIMTGPMSFAQSLSENLVFGSASTSEKAVTTVGNIIGKPTAPMNKSASPITTDNPAATPPKNEMEMHNLRTEPDIEGFPQREEMKAVVVNAIAADDTPIGKPERSASILLEEAGNKPATEKGKAEHKRGSSKTGVAGDIPTEIKFVATGLTGQDVHAEVATTAVPPVLLPMPSSAADGAVPIDESPAAIQGGKVRGNRSRQPSAAQGAKMATAMQEERKSRSIADEGQTHVDEGQPKAASAGDCQQSLIIPAWEKQPSKPEDMYAAIHAANPSIAAPSMSQPTTAVHVLTEGKSSSSAEAPPNAVLNSSTPELPQSSAQGHRILSATTSTIEVGVSSGSHGWLKIRAEMTDAGTVKASLALASATGQEILHRDLPLLLNYLEQERIPVSSLAVHQTAPSEIGTALSDGGAAGDHSEGGSAGNRGQSQSFVNGNDIVVPEGLLDLSLDNPAIASGMGGSWLNVRA